jgi:hypothetical protein
MTKARWNELTGFNGPELTESEVQEGWHWCNEFDGLLVGPGSHELYYCSCWPKDHPVYRTKPPLEPLGFEGD